MRDPNRIDIVLEAVRIVWKKAPDLRLGQMISNISYEAGYSDPFFLEDDRLLQVLTEKKERINEIMEKEWVDGKEIIRYRGYEIQVGYMEGLGEWIAIGVSFEEDYTREGAVRLAKEAIDRKLDKEGNNDKKTI